ncbi:hypothetical protein L7F22_016321 [Adiantum nelumboides]|nr:hypothetical protein [Adiantum nelumboides]
MATLFISQIFKYHGLPTSIVSDPRMTNNFWKGLFENLGIRLNFSSAYHPQTDGQIEIANLTILDLLKSYVTEVDQRSQWVKYLPLVEYAYNNTVHTSTGKASFKVIEGRSESPLLLKVHGKIFAADEYSRDLKESFQKIKEAISISQQKQKDVANKHRRALAFKENDWVLLKFPKARLRHTSGKNPTGHQKYYAKLAKRYYGPFQILKPINKMAYQLKLPNHWLIHNAFHVSLLKPYKGEPPNEAIIEDPPKVEDQEEVLQPESILRHEDKAGPIEIHKGTERAGLRYSVVMDGGMGQPPPEPVSYLCGDCGADNALKPGDVIQCRECGYRILYKKRTRRIVQYEAR